MSGLPTPILFPEHVSHNDVAFSILERFPGYKVLSAGFCSIGQYGVNCWGESISLKVKSDPNDFKYVQMMIKG